MRFATEHGPTHFGSYMLASGIAYLVTRVLFAAMHFHYNLFFEPFNVAKAAVDLGSFVLVYGAVLWIRSMLEARSGQPDARAEAGRYPAP
jgi:hypothetical protein